MIQPIATWRQLDEAKSDFIEHNRTVRRPIVPARVSSTKKAQGCDPWACTSTRRLVLRRPNAARPLRLACRRRSGGERFVGTDVLTVRRGTKRLATGLIHDVRSKGMTRRESRQRNDITYMECVPRVWELKSELTGGK